MIASVQQLYREYLRREVSLDDLRDWLTLNQWDLNGLDEELADAADVALAHLDDGYGDEEHVRSRLAFVLQTHIIATVQVRIGNIEVSSVPVGTAGAAKTLHAYLEVAA